MKRCATTELFIDPKKAKIEYQGQLKALVLKLEYYNPYLDYEGDKIASIIDEYKTLLNKAPISSLDFFDKIKTGAITEEENISILKAIVCNDHISIIENILDITAPHLDPKLLGEFLNNISFYDKKIFIDRIFKENDASKLWGKVIPYLNFKMIAEDLCLHQYNLVNNVNLEHVAFIFLMENAKAKEMHMHHSDIKTMEYIDYKYKIACSNISNFACVEERLSPEILEIIYQEIAYDALKEFFISVPKELIMKMIARALSENFIGAKTQEEILIEKQEAVKYFEDKSYEVISKLSVRELIDNLPLQNLPQWGNAKALQMAHSRVIDALMTLRKEGAIPRWFPHKQRQDIIHAISQTKDATKNEIKEAIVKGLKFEHK